jgi:hypothetical protein
MMRLTDFLTSIGRPIAYYPSLNRITGGVLPTILLCQLVYWHDKGDDPEGWIFKTQEQLWLETGLSRWEQESARKALRTRGLLHEKFAGLPRKLYFRPDIAAINDAWDARPTRLELPT